MKKILKKVVKAILCILLILVFAFISVFIWDRVGFWWREITFKPKPELTVIGKPFIDFEAELPDSTVHRFSEYAGKGDRNPAAWHYALGQHACPWPMLHETIESQQNHTSASDLYSISGFPTFVLLDPDGKVIFSPYEEHGYTEDERKQLIEKLAEIFEE